MRNMFSEQYGVEYDGAVDYLMKERKAIKDPVALSELCV